MEEVWKAAFRAGKYVGVIGFVAYHVLIRALDTEILSLFSTQQKFLLVYTITVGVIFCLLTVIFLSTSKKADALVASQKNTTTSTSVSVDRTSIGGDFVVGDKKTRD